MTRPRAAVTVGMFDGVHRGHVAVLARARAAARGAGVPAAAVTFDPHPMATLAPERCPQLLTTVAEREGLLRAHGMDRVLVLTFDCALAALGPADFLDRLEDAVAIAALVVGPDHALGHHREGTPGVLAALGRERGFPVTSVEPVLEDGVPVSSRRIRALVAEGHVESAERLLGRRYALEGDVVAGDARGASLGFPTANIAVPRDKLLPADGVYAVLVEGDGLDLAPRAGAMNVGVRPTFASDARRVVEVHVLDFAGDLRGRRLTVSVVARLRPELRFPTAADLTAQMARDVEETRRVLEGARAAGI